MKNIYIVYGYHDYEDFQAVKAYIDESRADDFCAKAEALEKTHQELWGESRMYDGYMVRCLSLDVEGSWDDESVEERSD